ncbi:hypothetical protein [Citreicella sp. C3M06]|uniref:hypothetical protein n=1 Tax=Citreicella sp. C3M06 TaxID=2841564 RepID=UPI002091E307|nr:hypothetical protein [Citreicella sp. C3M06]
MLIERDLKIIMSACERPTVMNMGRLRATGAPAEITCNQEVIKAYPGQGHHPRQEHST